MSCRNCGSQNINTVTGPTAICGSNMSTSVTYFCNDCNTSWVVHNTINESAGQSNVLLG